MKKVALADVLWDAANKFLSTNTESDYVPSLGWVEQYSCLAVDNALASRDAYMADVQARAFLQTLGVNTSFDGYTFGQRAGEARQGVRYMWLLLAMHVAQDEGIEVEVSQW